MIIHKKLKPFLETIHNENINFKDIECWELRKHFKNNEYYNLKTFCIDNELIIVEYSKIKLSPFGISFFNILKKCKKI